MRTDEYENGWSGQKQDFMNQIRCQLDPKLEGGCLETQRSEWCKTGSSVEMYGVESWVCVVQGGGDADWLDWRATSIQAGSSVTQIRFIPFYDSQLRPIKLPEHVANFCKNYQ